MAIVKYKIIEFRFIRSFVIEIQLVENKLNKRPDTFDR